jgi:acetylornithine deacetylase
VSELAELLSALVAIDSVNPDVVPGGAGEGEIAGYVAGWLERAGLEVETHQAAPGRPNVVGVARGTGGGRTLLLNAHTDTVGVAGMDRGHKPRIEGNRLYGRGAYDMKAGLAAIMLAGAAAARAGLAGDVIVAAVADEEFASAGTRAIVERYRADAAIVTEPTELRLGIAHKGFVALQLETTGVAAHGSRPDLGVDAIVKMGRVLVALEQLDRSFRADGGHPLLGGGSLHASLIEGGQEFSSYPDRCVLGAERRTIPGESSELVLDQIQAALDGLAEQDADLHVSVKELIHREPFEIEPDEAIVQLVRGHAARVLGAEPDLVGMSFWADSGLLAAAGIPTVLFGPGGEGAHAVVEWADLDEAERCTEILVAVAGDFCR